MFGLEFSTLLQVFLIFFLGGFIKGVLGFGLPLITMSLLPFVINVQTAIALSAIIQPFTNITQMIQSGGLKQAFRDTMPVLLTLAPGVFLGAWFLASLDSAVILLIVGCMVVLFALYNLVGFRVLIAESMRIPVGLANGFVAGVVGGLTSVNGPFFIMYLVGLGQDRQNFRSSIAVLFLISGTLISSGLWFVGFVDFNILVLGVLVLAPAFAGMWAGNVLGKRIPNDTFRRIILIGLLVIGAMFIVRSLAGI